MLFRQSLLNIDTQDIADKVHKLRPYWIQRLEVPFYTLGRCAYLDGKTSEYANEIKETNPILYSEFKDLYGSVGGYLANLLNEPIYLDENLAFPSFHIAESHPYFTIEGGKWHQDYPHTTLGLGDKDPLTFTVAIQLPSDGAGLDYIDLDGEQHYLEYVERGIVIHDGSIEHRISPAKSYKPNEYRITLQGHLIRVDGVLKMFW